MVKETRYPKHIIEINGIQVNLGNNIVVDYDMDNTYYTGSFTLPDITSLDITQKEKEILMNVDYLAAIRIYYKEFTNEEDMFNATSEDLDLVVNGYATDVNTNETKEDAIDRTITFNSMMGIAYDSSMQFDLIISDCTTTILNGLAQNFLIPSQVDSWDSYLKKTSLNNNAINQNNNTEYIYDFSAQSQSIYYNNLVSIYNKNSTLAKFPTVFNTYLPTVIGPNIMTTPEQKKEMQRLSIPKEVQTSLINKVVFDTLTHSKYFIVKANSTSNFGEALDTIKQNHVIKIFQEPDGTLKVVTPTYFYNQTVDVLQFDLTDNVQSVSFGGLSNLFNAVMVHGTGATGFAFDPIAYEMAIPKNTKSPLSDDINSKTGTYEFNPDFTNPDPKYLRIKHLFRRNIFNDFDAYTTAVNELYNISKSATVTFETIYNKNIKPGMFFNLKNSNYLKNLNLKYSEEQAKTIADSQLWIIKSVKLKINKNDIGMTVVGYRNAIKDFPERLITPSNSLSLIDVNFLNTIEKNKNLITLH